MATIDDARSVWKKQASKFRVKTPTRTAFLGDGKGYATSNMIVADNPTMLYARENLGDKEYFVVPNFNVSVNPQFNLPVILGYDQTNPNIEQILGVDMNVFPYQSSASILAGLAPHHIQHEFGGGDEVFIDSELIKIGLFTPDNPPTYGGYIQPFYYSHKTSGLTLFSGSRIANVDIYKPSASDITRILTISFDTEIGEIVYRTSPDFSFSAGSISPASLWGTSSGSITIAGVETSFPSIPGGEIPLATFALTSTTTSLNWSATSSNYYHTRLFLGKIDTDIYNRLNTLESITNVSPLPRIGAGGVSGADRNIHDGDFRIGRINDQQTSGSSPSWGNRLYFSGALGTKDWNSENSDPLWIARYNAGNNISYMRVAIGDDNSSSTDAFQIGRWNISNDTFEPLYNFYSDGSITIESYERHLQIQASISGNPSTQPDTVAFFTAGGLQFSSVTTQYAYCQWEIPDDWDGSDIYFEVDWFADSGAMSGTDTVQWTIEYAAVAEGEVHGAGTSKTLTVTNSDDNAQYLSIHSRVTMPYNDVNQPLTAEDHVYFKIGRNTAVTNDFSGTVTVTAFEIIYNSNSLSTGN